MIKYAIWSTGNIEGEFEFLCSTQSHFTNSLEQALKEREDLIEEQCTNEDPPLTKEEVEDFIIFKLTVEVVK